MAHIGKKIALHPCGFLGGHPCVFLMLLRRFLFSNIPVRADHSQCFAHVVAFYVGGGLNMYNAVVGTNNAKAGIKSRSAFDRQLNQ